MAMRPATATLWLSEPDHSMHAAPLGSPIHLAALAHADAQVGRVAEAVDRLRDDGHEVLLMVGSDHGQESITEVMPLERRLFEAGFKRTLDGPELIVAPQGSAAFIHLGGDALAAKSEIVDWLRAQPLIGGVFVDDDLPALGQIPGDEVIGVDMAKTEGANVNGVPGLTATATRFGDDPDGRKRHCGVHGGRGAYETRPVLIAVGRGFAAGTVRRTPSSILDLTPTALAHLGLPVEAVDGRPAQGTA
jgi:arylsulfatase A-like enzyme